MTPVGSPNATISGTSMSVGGTGLTGTALIGTGTSSGTDFVNTGWNTNLTGSFTVGFWTSNVPTGSTLWYIFGDNTAGSFRCFTNGFAGANNWMMRCTGCPDITAYGAATSSANYVHFVYDAPGNMMRAYVDGVKVDSAAVAGTISLLGTGGFKVGGYASSSNLSGSMDEFRLYNRALTQAEILATYNISLGGCGTPENITTSNIGCDEVEIAWDSDSASIESHIEYGPSGFTPGTGTTINATSNPFTITGLSPSTDYDLYIHDSCTAGVSMRSDTAKFSTLPLPTATFMDSIGAITPVDAQVYFTAAASANGNSFHWDFGDGNNDSGMVVMHTYAKDSTYTVTLIVENDCGTDTITGTVSIMGISVDKWTMNSIQLFPNPSKGEVFFNGLKPEHGKHKFVVSDASGKSVHIEVKDVIDRNFSMDLSGLPNGVYFIEINTDEGTVTKTMLIKK
ncbi:MAG: T9SS type A sorting domain-containing protein [Cryomorphaceae bacterium]|nr:T9SS type A sorting domain-containing protein [Cryomorphaceae bacterium]